MNITVYRCTHQFGGSVIELSTASTRIIVGFDNEPLVI